MYESKFSGNFKNIPPSFIREILSVANQTNIISFAGGLPNPDFFPINQLAESACHVFREKGKSVLQYAGSQGYFPLCEWIANRHNTKYGLQIKPENIVITGGSQQTLDITSKMFINKGDSIIVERPTYLGAIQAMSSYLPEFLTAELYDDDPDMEQIEKHCIEKDPVSCIQFQTSRIHQGYAIIWKKEIILRDIKEIQLISTGR